MPGPYAHITLLHELMKPARLKQIFSSSSGFGAALQEYFPYTALGAVSPDYPNLCRVNDAAPQWADAMHYTRSCAMMTSGIVHIKESRGSARDKQLAWLLGYCAHVVTDMTIHPVVQAKVGVYAENQRQHRVCEMNQDSYIYRRMDDGEIGDSDMFARIVAQCGNRGDRNQLDRDIVTLWEVMLTDVHPDLSKANQPDCAAWHCGFIARMEECQAGQVRIFPLAANIAAKMELSYPRYDQVDRQFIEEQVIPTYVPQKLHYDEIFDRAVDNVVAVWKMIEQALCDNDPALLPIFGDWNLDNGLDEHGRLVFWEYIN
jgi:hypothetical protein